MTSTSTIAVVGMACQLPGADQLDCFWDNIKNRRDFVGDVPPKRWIGSPQSMLSTKLKPDRAYSPRACFIRDFKFDPKGFRLNPELLLGLDPLHQLTLATGRRAFESCRTENVALEKTGVILAAIALPTDSSSAISRKLLTRILEKHFLNDPGRNEKFSLSPTEALAAKVVGFPASLLAAELGLGAGTYTLDAACASSSYALKLACDELRSGRADMMLTGGVSRPECLYTQVGFSQLKALSPSGRCAPFDAAADGLVVGEGAGILVLKRIEDALTHGDTIYGLIKGIGLSNDMRGNLLAPDSDGQLRAMQAAYADAGWSPADVDYIECHGTGTPTGDTIELQSLCRLWGDTGWQQGQCAIGSVKSMIGHLLTAASAAGMIKTLLAMHHGFLPPSLNFTRPAQNSPLDTSPFHVQTQTAPWPERAHGIPKRAAVSAFGFGGINAHVLLESPTPDLDKNKDEKITVVSHGVEEQTKASSPPIAVVGMETIAGSLTSLGEFQEAVFNGRTILKDRPDHRWKGVDDIAHRFLEKDSLPGAYLDNFTINVGEFQIPPNEIKDILPQQLLMLKVAAGALLDADLPLREHRPRMGAVIGINFDMEATNFHMRWSLARQIEELKHASLSVEDQEKLRPACGPPLTAPRTLGALGGIVASRIAREFRFGGPSFVVSAEEASGMKALEIGTRSLARGELDAVLIGAIDLSGDLRTILAHHCLAPFSATGDISPFDQSADGSAPGEGAVALVLKRLPDALAHENRIYALIGGMGNASGTEVSIGADSKSSYRRSLERVFADASWDADTTDYIETHGGAVFEKDQSEINALDNFFQRVAPNQTPPLVGTLAPIIGRTGAATGLFAVAKTCLGLFHQIIPPAINYTHTDHTPLKEDRFHLPRFAHYWLRNRNDGPRRALVAAMTIDGGSSHVLLEEFYGNLPDKVAAQAAWERKRPLGLEAFGLFALNGQSKEELLHQLTELEQFLLKNAEKNGHHLEEIARSWYQTHPVSSNAVHRLSLVARDRDHLVRWIDQARIIVANGKSARISGPGGIAYAPIPLSEKGELAFVYPGSGNHYVGMGRKVGLYWPHLLRQMDEATLKLKDQIQPHLFVPTRSQWIDGWEKESMAAIAENSLTMIFGQVVHGGLMTRLIQHFGVSPKAVIGYSLGQTTGYFATGAWSERGEMLSRMQNNPLFTTELTGPCNSARKIWKIDHGTSFQWQVAAVNRSADQVRKIIKQFALTRLLIVNTPYECVIGGDAPQVRELINALGCDAVYLDGVVSVHCEAVEPVAQAYHDLHLFPTQPPKGLRYYNCAAGKAHELTKDSAAQAILQQALKGFDFTQTIHSAHADGVRFFVEMGPHASCSRMIRTTLGDDRPHLAESICQRGEDDYFTLLKLFGNLMAHGVSIDLDMLYGDQAYPPRISRPVPKPKGKAVVINIGGHQLQNVFAQSVPFLPSPCQIEIPQPPVIPSKSDKEESWQKPSVPHEEPNVIQTPDLMKNPYSSQPQMDKKQPEFPPNDMLRTFNITQEETVKAHNQFLDFSIQLQKAMGETLMYQNALLAKGGGEIKVPESSPQPDLIPDTPSVPPAFSREMCMEFAVGSVGRVLGPEFAIVDTYPARVRLPDEPLMLVDRILEVEGEKGSLTSGRVVTEHDVKDGAWYLDGNRAPVCISVEAGQADLFLSGYLGIDLKVKGLRTYRLLDAKVSFHRQLPQPGDTIRYEIHIDKFIRQQDTYLFFFRYEGYIGDSHLITMTDGCAGFFTAKEVEESGGIILTTSETASMPGKRPADWKPLAPMAAEKYSDHQIQALQKGNLSACFGTAFEHKVLAESLHLPAGRMHLIHRVLTLEPDGGRFGLGRIVAEADIHPDDWFLTCHFVDDKVMPGTLMYECCAHALRIFLQRMGWITNKPGVCYGPKLDVPVRLKCRGPVTPTTKHVQYEVIFKEIGYDPEPYAIADALMYADGHRIVFFEDMSLKLTGITRDEIEAVWQQSVYTEPAKAIFTHQHILEFAVGRPSKAFGDRYKIFDQQRKIARLPGPPYCFIDRITKTAPAPWELKPDGWVEAEVDVSAADWYFIADRSGAMPFCVLLEIALQPCGWLAAYAGSALHSESDLKFRNLGGNGIVHRHIPPEDRILTMRSRLTKVAKAADMIVENFDFEVLADGQPVYTGDTYFGFFTKSALENQKGLPQKDHSPSAPLSSMVNLENNGILETSAPFLPQDAQKTETKPSFARMSLPAKALLMVDRITAFAPTGGPKGLGYIRGEKKVNPKEWFFDAHFYQDPVCPGSLGIESFLQLLKFYAKKLWPDLSATHCFEIIPKHTHNWTYRGQIIQTNQLVTIEAVITKIIKTPMPMFFADGWLSVDGLYIYKMENFGLRLVQQG